MLLNRSFRQLLLPILATIWLVAIVNWFLSYQLNRYGLLPRELSGLIGIATMPFLHGDFYHLMSNTIGFLSLGWLVSLYSTGNNKALLVKLTLFVAFWGGLLTWILARSSFHVGLSGVIFGYWGFITINGFFEKSLKSIFISIIAVFFYWSMAFGVLPTSPNISFEGHLFGAISGVMYSYWYRRKGKRRE